MSDETFSKLLQKLHAVSSSIEKPEIDHDFMNNAKDDNGDRLDSVKLDLIKLFLEDVYITSDQGIMIMDNVEDEFEKVFADISKITFF